MKQNPFLRAALAYASRLEWPVFPLKPQAKEPLTQHGCKDGTLDLAQIKTWWSKWPNANIGIPTGIKFWALDIDPRHGGDESLRLLVYEHGALTDTIQQMTGGGGRQYLYDLPDQQKIGCLTAVWDGIDIRGEGGYIVVPPSIHPSKRPYVWDGATSITEQILATPDAWLLLELAKKIKPSGPFTLPEIIKKGAQYKTLHKMGSKMRGMGAEEPEIFAALWAAMQSRCEDPDQGPEKMKKLARDICKRYPAGPSTAPPPVVTVSKLALPGPQFTLTEVQQVFSRWLHLPDPGIITLTLGAIAANRLKGDAVWLLLIGPPASGKTEILDSLLELPDMHSAGTLTEAALLTGVPRREHAANASGGLLRAIGEFGFIVLKDLTSTLSMGREARSLLLAALREIHDGAWTRHFGTDGGKALHWKGKCALIGGCTPIIDEHHAVMASMGERFLLCRLPEVDTRAQAQQALEHLGKEVEMRCEMTQAVNGLFRSFQPAPFHLDEPTRKRLSALAAFTSRARSAVIRDSYKRDIDLVPGTERPARLVLALARLFHGMRVVGASETEAWRLICALSLDCIPEIRRRVFEQIYPYKQVSTTDIAVAIDYPTTTARRALEDLAAHGILTRTSRGSGRSDEWEISPVCNELIGLETTFPEMLGQVKRKSAGA